MTKDELKKEAEEWIINNSKDFITNPNYSPFDYAEATYLASAEPREKRIAELEKENAELKRILNIRSCQNCRHNSRDCPNDGSCKHYSKWEGYENPQLSKAKENEVIIHNLKENPDDLPKCDESKTITFYVEEWIESIQKYKKHYCLGFYKKSFMNEDVKLFVEKSIGYENEHLPKTVIFWYENPTV